MFLTVFFLSLQCDVSHSPLAGCEGMRLRGRRDSNPDSHLELLPSPPAVTWLPGVLTKGVRLRLRLDHRDDRGRSCWHLVDLEAEAGSVRRRPRARAPDTCTQSKNSYISVNTLFLLGQSVNIWWNLMFFIAIQVSITVYTVYTRGLLIKYSLCLTVILLHNRLRSF